MPLAGWEEGWMRKQDREAAERDEQDPADDACALTRQMAENDRLRAEVARLREALQPFATYAKTLRASNDIPQLRIGHDHNSPIVGDCYRAQEVLNP